MSRSSRIPFFIFMTIGFSSAACDSPEPQQTRRDKESALRSARLEASTDSFARSWGASREWTKSLPATSDLELPFTLVLQRVFSDSGSILLTGYLQDAWLARSHLFIHLVSNEARLKDVLFELDCPTSETAHLMDRTTPVVGLALFAAPYAVIAHVSEILPTGSAAHQSHAQISNGYADPGQYQHRLARGTCSALYRLDKGTP